MKPRISRRRRALRWIIAIIAIAVVGLYIVLPVSFGVAAVAPGKETVGSPPAGFERVSLNAGDDVTLAGWYSPPANGAAIILLHGAGGSREAVRPLAELLSRNGYGVLALDQRGHGESSGGTNRLGWQGTSDVGTAVAYLQGRQEVKTIGGLGWSMGGEVLLGAAADYPAIRAIAADGASRRSTQELTALPSERPLIRSFTARVMYATVQLLSGDKPPAPPLLDSMRAAGSTAFLLIAGGANSLEARFNELFAETIGESAVLWVAPEAPHTGAFDRYPSEYEQRLIGFFDAMLLGGNASADTQS